MSVMAFGKGAGGFIRREGCPTSVDGFLSGLYLVQFCLQCSYLSAVLPHRTVDFIRNKAVSRCAPTHLYGCCPPPYVGASCSARRPMPRCFRIPQTRTLVGFPLVGPLSWNRKSSFQILPYLEDTCKKNHSLVDYSRPLTRRRSSAGCRRSVDSC